MNITILVLVLILLVVMSLPAFVEYVIQELYDSQNAPTDKEPKKAAHITCYKENKAYTRIA